MYSSTFSTRSEATPSCYPFRMEMPGRTYTSNSYRYGFNGMEKDGELTGNNANNLDFKFRIYDARLGKFLSVDPLSREFAWNSPYAFAENRVIDGIDLEGLEWTKNKYVTRTTLSDGTTVTTVHTEFVVKLKVVNSSDIVSDVEVTNIIENAISFMEKEYNTEESRTSRNGKHKHVRQFSIKVEVEYVENTSNLDSDFDFYLEFVDKIGDEEGYIIEGADPEDYGYVYEIGGTQNNRIQINASSAKSQMHMSRTFIHELFHTGGLEHPYQDEQLILDNPGKNIMTGTNYAPIIYETTPGLEIEHEQMKKVDTYVPLSTE